MARSDSRKVYPSREIISRARGMKYSSKLNARPIARKNPLSWRKLQTVFLRINQSIGLLPMYSLVLPHRVEKEESEYVDRLVLTLLFNTLPHAKRTLY